MSEKKKTKPAAAKNPAQFPIVRDASKPIEQQMADVALLPAVRNALVAGAFAASSFGDPVSGIVETTTNVTERCKAVRAGSLDGLTDILTAQAVALDTIFTEMARRAALNLGAHPEAVDRYLNLALKAQSHTRTTVESVARIKRDGKQVVRVVHVHEGGQAVVAETINTGEAGGQPLAGPNNLVSKAPYHLSKRCLARTRRGTACLCPAMKNGRCRIHGGLSPGAPLGNKNAWKHGARSAETRMLAAMLRQMRAEHEA